MVEVCILMAWLLVSSIDLFGFLFNSQLKCFDQYLAISLKCKIRSYYCWTLSIEWVIADGFEQLISQKVYHTWPTKLITVKVAIHELLLCTNCQTLWGHSQSCKLPFHEQVVIYLFIIKSYTEYKKQNRKKWN